MAYKDKEKQKEAQRERTRRYRSKQKGVTSEGVTQGVTIPADVLATQAVELAKQRQEDEEYLTALPANFGEPDCQCTHCKNNRTHTQQLDINHGAWKPADRLGKNEINRVTLPGDIDYEGVAAPPVQ